MALVTLPEHPQYTKLENIPEGTDLAIVFRMLELRVEELEKQILWEAELRKQYPVLQDLWEKFLVTKQLVAKE